MVLSPIWYLAYSNSSPELNSEMFTLSFWYDGLPYFSVKFLMKILQSLTKSSMRLAVILYDSMFILVNSFSLNFA